VHVEATAREAYRSHAVVVQRAAVERSRAEFGGAPRPGFGPRTVALSVPATHPAGYAATSHVNTVRPNTVGQRPPPPRQPVRRPPPKNEKDEKKK
jgi:hypothetical protein